jgi:hypothetical protein
LLDQPRDGQVHEDNRSQQEQRQDALPYNYANRQGIHPISWEDFHGLCKGLAQAVYSYRPEIILAIGRGGYYPGTLLAHMLQVEIFPVRVSRRFKDMVKYKRP